MTLSALLMLAWSVTIFFDESFFGAGAARAAFGRGYVHLGISWLPVC